MDYANKHQRDSLRNILLEVLRAEGELTLIFTAPGEAPHFMRPFMDGHEVDRKKFDRALSVLKKRDEISVKEDSKGVTLILTKAGENKAIKYSLDELALKRPERWDGKWRVVMFDIPDEKKVARNSFSQILNQLGFITIQKSVYAHPFPCEDELELIRNVYEIRPYVKILKAEVLEGEEKFLSRFGLTRSR